MRAALGVVSLLIVLGAIALAASRQSKTAFTSVATPTAAMSASTARDQLRQIDDKARQDVNQALDQATKRTQEADQ